MVITYNKRDNMMKLLIQQIQREIKTIEQIILFGSTVRQDDRLNSDIDVALIGKQALDTNQRNKINDIVTNLLVDHGILINWIYFLQEKWEQNTHDVIKNIKEEGKLLWVKEKTPLN